MSRSFPVLGSALSFIWIATLWLGCSQKDSSGSPRTAGARGAALPGRGWDVRDQEARAALAQGVRPRARAGGLSACSAQPSASCALSAAPRVSSRRPSLVGSPDTSGASGELSLPTSKAARPTSPETRGRSRQARMPGVQVDTAESGTETYRATDLGIDADGQLFTVGTTCQVLPGEPLLAAVIKRSGEAPTAALRGRRFSPRPPRDTQNPEFGNVLVDSCGVFVELEDEDPPVDRRGSDVGVGVPGDDLRRQPRGHSERALVSRSGATGRTTRFYVQSTPTQWTAVKQFPAPLREPRSVHFKFSSSRAPPPSFSQPPLWSGWTLESTADDGGHWATLYSFEAEPAPNGAALQSMTLAATIAPSGDLLIASTLTDLMGDYVYLDLRRKRRRCEVPGRRCFRRNTSATILDFATFSSMSDGSVILPTVGFHNQMPLITIERCL